MKERFVSFDFIRFVAIILVVCIHSQGALREAVVMEVDPYGELHWCRALWHVIYVAVPLFVMLSGALLLGKQESFSDFFKRRLTRVLVPFVVWSIILGFLLYYKTNHSLYGSIEWIISQTFSSGIYHVYWYIYLIIGLYLITPILRLVILNGGKATVLYMIILILSLWGANLVLPSFDLVNRFACENLIFIAYFIIGYYVNKYIDLKIETNKQKCIWVLAFITLYAFGVGLHVIGGLSIFNKMIELFEAILLFILLSKWDYKWLAKTTIALKGVTVVSEISYGMYLTHCAFISLLVSIPFVMNLSLTIEPLVVASLAFCFDGIAVFILKKIGLKKWVL